MNTKTIAYVTLFGFVTAATLHAEQTNIFKDDREKTSYAIGVSIGNNWKRQEIDTDYDWLVRGIKDAKDGGTVLLSEQEVREVLGKYQQELKLKQQEKQRQLVEKNKKDGEAFLAENKGKPGVITLTNGLQYKVITEGTGDMPKADDTVTVNYRGTLVDGTEFDSSIKRGQPATFPVNGVIRGWTEALTRMKVGSKWQLFIPSELAYGQRGSPPKISPDSALIFEVELISVQHAPPPPHNQPLTSDIIKVPSLEEMKKGAKIETIKAEDVEKLQKQQQTNAPENK